MITILTICKVVGTVAITSAITFVIGCVSAGFMKKGSKVINVVATVSTYACLTAVICVILEIALVGIMVIIKMWG